MKVSLEKTEAWKSLLSKLWEDWDTFNMPKKAAHIMMLEDLYNKKFSTLSQEHATYARLMFIFKLGSLQTKKSIKMHIEKSDKTDFQRFWNANIDKLKLPEFETTILINK